LTAQELTQAAALVYSNRHYCQHFFPRCDTVERVKDILRTLDQEWHVIDDKTISAVFTLETLRALTKIDRLCINASLVKEVASELANLPRTTQTTISAPLELISDLSKSGFESQGIEVKLSRVPHESRTMQLLPLSSPSEKDIPELSRAMYEAYLESRWSKYPDAAATERRLRSLISEKNSDHLQDCSFMSKAGDKIVSACLIMGDYTGAAVSELFTHPLYRARGLATTELTACANSLALAKIPLLRVSVAAENEVLIRLLSKLGFSEDIRYTIMIRPKP